MGDSLAGGLPHLSFSSHLTGMLPGWDLSVSARGGETLAGVGSRLKALLSRHQPDAVILEAGANDILLPYLEERGGPWRRLVKWMTAGGNLPATDPTSFETLLARILKSLPGRPRSVILTTIPCLGEDRSSHLNLLRERYNMAISKVATDLDLPLADAGKAFRDILSHLEDPSPYLMDDFTGLFTDALRALTPRTAYQLSGRRGLVLTLDGVHPNPLGAEILARAVAEAITGRRGFSESEGLSRRRKERGVACP